MANGKASGHRSAFDHPVGRVETGGTSLRWLPTDFDIDDYLDASSKPRIPLTPGRVTFLLSHSQQVRLYDTVDFWRVAAVTPGETLQLSAEMRLPVTPGWSGASRSRTGAGNSSRAPTFDRAVLPDGCTGTPRSHFTA